jgi:hypothetical protein
MSAEVKREHREQAADAYFHGEDARPLFSALWTVGDRFTVVVGSDMALTLGRLKAIAQAIADAAQPGDALRDRLAKVRGMAGYHKVQCILRAARTDQLRMAANAEQVDCGEYTGEAACAADAIAAVLALLDGGDDV